MGEETPNTIPKQVKLVEAENGFMVNIVQNYNGATRVYLDFDLMVAELKTYFQV